MEVRISEREIRTAVQALALRIDADYAGRVPVFVGLLKGAYIFLADLSRAVSLEHEVDFLRARSYGAGTVSSGQVEITKDVELELRGRDVIVVDDILDTGLTLRAVVAHLRGRGTASVRTCALVVRAGREPADYTGLETGPGFIVGYGLDRAERHRGLPDIRVLPAPVDASGPAASEHRPPKSGPDQGGPP